MEARIVKQWADHRLDLDLYDTYFLTRHDDPAWFRPIEARNDETAIAEAERVILEDGDGPPIRWELQPHSKEAAFKIALQVREETLKHGEEPSPLRELVSLACRIEWMF